MNIKINKDELFNEDIISILDSLNKRISNIENKVFSDENTEDDSESCCEDCYRGRNLSEDLVPELITSMKRLREYDAQKYREYYNYLEEDDDILYELDVRHDED